MYKCFQRKNKVDNYEQLRLRTGKETMILKRKKKKEKPNVNSSSWISISCELTSNKKLQIYNNNKTLPRAPELKMLTSREKITYDAKIISRHDISYI